MLTLGGIVPFSETTAIYPAYQVGYGVPETEYIRNITLDNVTYGIAGGLLVDLEVYLQ